VTTMMSTQSRELRLQRKGCDGMGHHRSNDIGLSGRDDRASKAGEGRRNDDGKYPVGVRACAGTDICRDLSYILSLKLVQKRPV
jgi:hypothetical protein